VDRGFLEKHAIGWERLLEHARPWTLERAASAARVEAKEIAALAEAYAGASPALVRCGWGLERNRNGEASVAAVLALPAIAGKFGKRGGGYAMSSSGTYQVSEKKLSGTVEPASRAVNMNHLGRALLEETDPPIRALFVYNANPVVTVPDQGRILKGLSRPDLFTVVFDQVMTDSALWADIVLPATTFLEHLELCTSYGGYAVMLGEPVVSPEGEARSNEQVFTEIGRRLGIPGAETWPLGEDQVVRGLAAIEGPLAERDPTRRLQRLREEKILKFDFPGERPVQMATAMPRTSDRKIHLWPEEVWPAPFAVRDLKQDGAGRWPLALISPSSDRTISSTMAEYGFKEAALVMHPGDAAERGLPDGARVRVHNELGEVLVRLKISDEMRRGVVNLPKGIWNRHTANNRVGTWLVPDAVTLASGGACFNDARVEVERA
jgi:anaerobic selenocysteine-containing dehydrogenase